MIGLIGLGILVAVLLIIGMVFFELALILTALLVFCSLLGFVVNLGLWLAFGVSLGFWRSFGIGLILFVIGAIMGD